MDEWCKAKLRRDASARTQEALEVVLYESVDVYKGWEAKTGEKPSWYEWRDAVRKEKGWGDEQFGHWVRWMSGRSKVWADWFVLESWERRMHAARDGEPLVIVVENES